MPIRKGEAWGAPGALPPDGVLVEYTRPVYPYPQRVAYSGSGDVNDAASYTPYTPPARDDHFAWGGTFLGH